MHTFDAHDMQTDVRPVGSGDLQPRHVSVTLANFIKPPVVGVGFAIERVCSPSSSDLSGCSRIGSNSRLSGSASWWSR